MTTAEFSKFAGILKAALSQHHLLGFEIAQQIDGETVETVNNHINEYKIQTDQDRYSVLGGLVKQVVYTQVK